MNRYRQGYSRKGNQCALSDHYWNTARYEKEILSLGIGPWSASLGQTNTIYLCKSEKFSCDSENLDGQLIALGYCKGYGLVSILLGEQNTTPKLEPPTHTILHFPSWWLFPSFLFDTQSSLSPIWLLFFSS